MALILPVEDKEPQFGDNAFIAENATIVGDVTCGEDCSFWFQSVVRGDVNFIKMGNKVNVQDGAIIHGTFKTAGTTIGNNVSIGHRALVHGCTIEDNVLIGMGAIVMDKCVIGKNSIIGAGSVVLENTIVEPGSIYAGIPAKKIKDLDQEKSERLLDGISNNYVKYAKWFK